MKKPAESTGFPAPNEQGGCESIGQTPAPLLAAWVSDSLLEDTRRVWSRQYGRPVSAEEAVEILMNVKRLAEVIVQAYDEGEIT